jgi:hypothetical protein
MLQPNNELKIKMNELHLGAERIQEIFGYDEIIDNLLENREVPNEVSENLHEQYSSMGANQLQNLFQNLVIESINLKDFFKGFIYDDIFAHIYHLSFQHLIPKLYSTDDSLLVLFDETISKLQTQLLICLYVSIAVWISSNIIILFFISYLHSIFKMQLSLFLRLPLPSIVSNPLLMNFLFHIKTKMKRSELDVLQ